MALPITALAAAALALLLVGLTVHAVRLRKRHGVAFGDGGHPPLRRAIRAHGNLIEYMPIGLTMIALLEGSGEPRCMLAPLATLFVAARLVHGFGVQREGERIGPLRSWGIVTTLAVLTIMAVWLAVLAGRSLGFWRAFLPWDYS